MNLADASNRISENQDNLRAPEVSAKSVLQKKLKAVDRLLKAASEQDIKGEKAVHQLRVATRRASAALSMFKSSLKKSDRDRMRKVLRRVRRVASEARQCDVHMTMLEQRRESADAALGALLVTVGEQINEQRREAQRAIVRAARVLADGRVRRHRRRLTRQVADDNRLDSLKTAVRDAIAQRGQQFTVAASQDLTQLHNIHEMRLAGKRLRYALEFETDSENPTIESLRSRVEQLQDHLGSLNDHEELITRLDTLAESDVFAAPQTDARQPIATMLQSSLLANLLEEYRAELSRQHDGFLSDWQSGKWADLLDGIEKCESCATETLVEPSATPTTEAATAPAAVEPVSTTTDPSTESPRRIAAIDVGTNSIRLVIAEVFPDGRLRIIDDEKAVTRLGQGLSKTRRLTAKSMNESAIALAQFKAIAEGYRVDALRAVATCAVREARNGREFVDMVNEKAGVNLEVITAETEARLAFRSVSNAFDLRSSRTAVVDIGGGSTEIILGSGNLIEQIYPIPLGAIRLTEKFRIADDIPNDRYRKMRALIRKTLRDRVGSLPFLPHLVVGTGGTFTTLAAISIQRGIGTQTSEFLPFTVRGYEMQRSELKHILDQLRDLSLNGRLRVPGVSPERADIIVAGLAIIDCVLKHLQVNALRVHDQGIRAGLLHSMADELFPAAERTAPTQPDRMRSVRQFAVACNFEQAHAEHVARLSLEVFDQLAQELGEESVSWATTENRELLEAAALVHDVGYFINYSKHHKHSYHLVMHSELDGFTHRQREIIANIARYHRGATPKKSQANFARLSSDDRDVVRRLAAILRIADGLDRSHTQQVQSLELHCHEGVAFVRLSTLHEATVDVWGSMRKAPLFEKLFDLKVRFSCASAPMAAVHSENQTQPLIEVNGHADGPKHAAPEIVVRETSAPVH